jgi:hypothetical protein
MILQFWLGMAFSGNFQLGIEIPISLKPSKTLPFGSIKSSLVVMGMNKGCVAKTDGDW